MPMAGAAVMLAAGAGIAGGRLAAAGGANGWMFGWRRAGEPKRWFVRPAAPPVGPQLVADAQPQPAIGDSAVLDACGFGAPSLRFSPEMVAALGDAAPAVCAGLHAHDAFVGGHPLLPFEGLKLGLDLDSPSARPGVILAILDAAGDAGPHRARRRTVACVTAASGVASRPLRSALDRLIVRHILDGMPNLTAAPCGGRARHRR
jgi:hypothetical protein